MICPNCGAQLPDTVTMCYSCKTKFDWETHTYYTPDVEEYFPNKDGSSGKKIVYDPKILDIIAMIAIFISLIAYAGKMYIFSHTLLFVVLIIYWIIYRFIKDNPEFDASKVKQSLNITAAIYAILFIIGIVIQIKIS